MSKKDKAIEDYTGAALKTKAREVPRQAIEFEYELDGITFKEIHATPVLNKEKEPVKEKIDPYLPDPTLVEAVALMRILQRPLLLRGEPGCGKTKVAQAVAFEWYGDDYRQHYFEWHVKSSSKAQDGLYTFDHIARLRNANARTQDGVVKKESKAELAQYRELGPLGQAFLASEPGRPAILLIDEIDKADIDFPNDLLLELDEMRFVIPQTGEEIIPRQKPLIFITSNQERELPQAFLRRCLFHYIKFPDGPLLRKIMLANFPSFERKGESGQKFVEKAIEKFEQLRKDLNANPTANKNVSTSELKDWIRILEHFFSKGEMDITKLESVKPRYHTALLKTENDLKSLNMFEK